MRATIAWVASLRMGGTGTDAVGRLLVQQRLRLLERVLSALSPRA
jgi:hypothetical protein